MLYGALPEIFSARAADLRNRGCDLQMVRCCLPAVTGALIAWADDLPPYEMAGLPLCITIRNKADHDYHHTLACKARN